jgi:hypothetical protein
VPHEIPDRKDLDAAKEAGRNGFVFEAASESGIEMLLGELAFEPNALRLRVGVGSGRDYTNRVPMLGERSKKCEVTARGPTTRRKIRGIRGEEDSQGVPKYLVSLDDSAEWFDGLGHGFAPWRAATRGSGFLANRIVLILSAALHYHEMKDEELANAIKCPT